MEPVRKFKKPYKGRNWFIKPWVGEELIKKTEPTQYDIQMERNVMIGKKKLDENKESIMQKKLRIQQQEEQQAIEEQYAMEHPQDIKDIDEDEEEGDYGDIEEKDEEGEEDVGVHLGENDNLYKDDYFVSTSPRDEHFLSIPPIIDLSQYEMPAEVTILKSRLVVDRLVAIYHELVKHYRAHKERWSVIGMIATFNTKGYNKSKQLLVDLYKDSKNVLMYACLDEGYKYFKQNNPFTDFLEFAYFYHDHGLQVHSYTTFTKKNKVRVVIGTFPNKYYVPNKLKLEISQTSEREILEAIRLNDRIVDGVRVYTIDNRELYPWGWLHPEHERMFRLDNRIWPSMSSYIHASILLTERNKTVVSNMTNIQHMKEHTLKMYEQEKENIIIESYKYCFDFIFEQYEMFRQFLKLCPVNEFVYMGDGECSIYITEPTLHELLEQKELYQDKLNYIKHYYYDNDPNISSMHSLMDELGRMNDKLEKMNSTFIASREYRNFKNNQEAMIRKKQAIRGKMGYVEEYQPVEQDYELYNQIHDLIASLRNQIVYYKLHYPEHESIQRFEGEMKEKEVELKDAADRINIQIFAKNKLVQEIHQINVDIVNAITSFERSPFYEQHIKEQNNMYDTIIRIQREIGVLNDAYHDSENFQMLTVQSSRLRGLIDDITNKINASRPLEYPYLDITEQSVVQQERVLSVEKRAIEEDLDDKISAWSKELENLYDEQSEVNKKLQKIRQYMSLQEDIARMNFIIQKVSGMNVDEFSKYIDDLKQELLQLHHKKEGYGDEKEFGSTYQQLLTSCDTMVQRITELEYEDKKGDEQIQYLTSELEHMIDKTNHIKQILQDIQEITELINQYNGVINEFNAFESIDEIYSEDWESKLDDLMGEQVEAEQELKQDHLTDKTEKDMLIELETVIEKIREFKRRDQPLDIRQPDETVSGNRFKTEYITRLLENLKQEQDMLDVKLNAREEEHYNAMEELYGAKEKYIKMIDYNKKKIREQYETQLVETKQAIYQNRRIKLTHEQRIELESLIDQDVSIGFYTKEIAALDAPIKQKESEFIKYWDEQNKMNIIKQQVIFWKRHVLENELYLLKGRVDQIKNNVEMKKRYPVQSEFDESIKDPAEYKVQEIDVPIEEEKTFIQTLPQVAKILEEEEKIIPRGTMTPSITPPLTPQVPISPYEPMTPQIPISPYEPMTPEVPVSPIDYIPQSPQTPIEILSPVDVGFRLSEKYETIRKNIVYDNFSGVDDEYKGVNFIGKLLRRLRHYHFLEEYIAVQHRQENKEFINDFVEMFQAFGVVIHETDNGVSFIELGEQFFGMLFGQEELSFSERPPEFVWSESEDIPEPPDVEMNEEYSFTFKSVRDYSKYKLCWYHIKDYNKAYIDNRLYSFKQNETRYIDEKVQRATEYILHFYADEFVDFKRLLMTTYDNDIRISIPNYKFFDNTLYEIAKSDKPIKPIYSKKVSNYSGNIIGTYMGIVYKITIDHNFFVYKSNVVFEWMTSRLDSICKLLKCLLHSYNIRNSLDSVIDLILEFYFTPCVFTGYQDEHIVYEVPEYFYVLLQSIDVVDVDFMQYMTHYVIYSIWKHLILTLDITVVLLNDASESFKLNYWDRNIDYDQWTALRSGLEKYLQDTKMKLSTYIASDQDIYRAIRKLIYNHRILSEKLSNMSRIDVQVLKSIECILHINIKSYPQVTIEQGLNRTLEYELPYFGQIVDDPNSVLNNLKYMIYYIRMNQNEDVKLLSKIYFYSR